MHFSASQSYLELPDLLMVLYQSAQILACFNAEYNSVLVSSALSFNNHFESLHQPPAKYAWYRVLQSSSTTYELVHLCTLEMVASSCFGGHLIAMLWSSMPNVSRNFNISARNSDVMLAFGKVLDAWDFLSMEETGWSASCHYCDVICIFILYC